MKKIIAIFFLTLPILAFCQVNTTTKFTTRYKFLDPINFQIKVDFEILDKCLVVSLSDTIYMPFELSCNGYNKSIKIDKIVAQCDSIKTISGQQFYSNKFTINVFGHLVNHAKIGKLHFSINYWASNKAKNMFMPQGDDFSMILYSLPSDSIIKILYEENRMLKEDSSQSNYIINNLITRCNKLNDMVESKDDQFCCMGKFFEMYGHLPFVPCDDIKKAKICSKIHDKPIFLYFTGYGISDRSIDKILIENDSIGNLLKDKFIVVFLFVDDKMELPNNLQTDTVLLGKPYKINTFGKQNSFYQITKFNVFSQPYMAIVDNEENLLLNPLGYTNDINEFLFFLKTGIENYKKQGKGTQNKK